MATGSTTVSFGAGGSVYSTVDVTGQSGLTAGSFIEAFMMAEASASNTEDAHVAAPVRLVCEYLTAGSFRIHAFADFPLRDAFNIRWVTV